ncbi:MAG: rhodanese-related sulfurtransferase [Patescibacteria group bacterium]
MAERYDIILYYKYTTVADPTAFMFWHKSLCAKLSLKGRVLVAQEGINGTLEGTPAQIDEYCTRLTSQGDGGGCKFGSFSDIVFKRSEGNGRSFQKLIIKVRDEIVSAKLGNEDVNPNETTGVHLPPEELRTWYERGEAGKDFHIIDMRNTYEYKVGHFKGSTDAGMRNFRELKNVVKDFEHLKEKKILTVCTGGVRCEKASGYLIKKGFKDVYQLDGGMATYMQKFPGKDFSGSLYVFDNRITMDTTKERDVIGKCDYCKTTTEHYVNCINDECHLHFICCELCEQEREGKTLCVNNCVGQTARLSV